MKVTQIIKDAITANIKAKCEIANKDYKEALSKEMDRLAEEREQLMQEFRDEYKKAFMSMLDKLDSKNISYGHSRNYSSYYKETKDKEGLLENNYTRPYLSLTSDTAEDLKNQISANELKAQKYINDIILELELGANKPNLDALLNNITF